MYRPRHFDLTDTGELLGLVRDRSLGTLVVGGADGFEASPLPWVVRPAAEAGGSRTTLVGHLVRANPLVRMLADPRPGLVICDVVDAYVSPSLYPSKQTTHEVVPTWNYLSVHLHGQVRLVDDPEWIATAVAELTDRHEAGRSEPWSVGDAPEEFLARMYRGIIGVEMDVTRIEGKAKLSQNRTPQDRAAVLAAMLADESTAEMGRRMQRGI